MLNTPLTCTCVTTEFLLDGKALLPVGLLFCVDAKSEHSDVGDDLVGDVDKNCGIGILMGDGILM